MDVNMMLSVAPLWSLRGYSPRIHFNIYAPYNTNTFNSSSLIFIPPSALLPCRHQKHLPVNLSSFSSTHVFFFLCALHLPLLRSLSFIFSMLLILFVPTPPPPPPPPHLFLTFNLLHQLSAAAGYISTVSASVCSRDRAEQKRENWENYRLREREREGSH